MDASPAQVSPANPGWLRRVLAQPWLREPLLHFLLIGGLIFGLWSWLGAGGRSPQRIEVSAAEVQRLRVMAARQWGREPDAQQTAELVAAHIREEVLYREALAAGLDKDDLIVRRRLVQKLDFLAQGSVEEPSAAELQDYWQAHAANYVDAATLSLRQIYFSKTRHAGQTMAVAQAALKHLQAGQAAVAGDPFMLPTKLERQTEETLARDFGAEFTRQLFDAPVGRWSGPFDSALGTHLVFIERHDAARPSSFAEVRERVRSDLLNQRLLAARDSAYQAVLARYTVTVAADALAAGGRDAGLLVAKRP